MIQAGMELDYDLTSLAVMGFAEVLPKLREFFRVADIAEQSFARGEVDGVILVDFPGFNWHIAKREKVWLARVLLFATPVVGMGRLASQENASLRGSCALQSSV